MVWLRIKCFKMSEVLTGFCKSVDSSYGKRQFPHLNNTSSKCFTASSGRRFLPHGYGEDYEISTHCNQDCHRADFAAGLQLSPCHISSSEYAKFIELWPCSLKHLEPSSTIEQHPTRLTTQEKLPSGDRDLHRVPQYLLNRRNNLPLASPGDKCYRTVEYSPEFYKVGSTLPVVDFGKTSGMPDSSQHSVALLKSIKPKPFHEKEEKRKKQDEIAEVSELDNWRPASPLINQLMNISLGTTYSVKTRNSRRKD